MTKRGYVLRRDLRAPRALAWSPCGAAGDIPGACGRPWRVPLQSGRTTQRRSPATTADKQHQERRKSAGGSQGMARLPRCPVLRWDRPNSACRSTRIARCPRERRSSWPARRSGGGRRQLGEMAGGEPAVAVAGEFRAPGETGVEDVGAARVERAAGRDRDRARQLAPHRRGAAPPGRIELPARRRAGPGRRMARPVEQLLGLGEPLDRPAEDAPGRTRSDRSAPARDPDDRGDHRGGADHRLLRQLRRRLPRPRRDHVRRPRGGGGGRSSTAAGRRASRRSTACCAPSIATPC